MKVALFTDTFLPDVNGVARTLARWVRYLENHGVSCKVFAPQCDENPGTDYNSTMVERFYSIPFLFYPECKLAIPNPIHLKRTLMEFQPDLIHVATPFNLGLYGLHYGKKRKIPIVASYHTHFDQYLQYYKMQWVESMLWKYMAWFHQACSRIYVPSRSTMEYLEQRGFDNLEVWSRGVDPSRFHPKVNRSEVLKKYGVPEDKFVMLFVGRLAPEKSVDVVLETFRRLPERIRANASLILAGDGPLFKELTENNTDESVHFTGFVQGSELSSLYAAADLFVFPSATETFGNVVLEAMASGTAVIGAAAGGVMDTVMHGQNGWLCPAGDTDAFIQAVIHLYDNEGLRKHLESHGLAYSAEQNWDSIFTRLLDSYRQVILPGQEVSNYVLTAVK